MALEFRPTGPDSFDLYDLAGREGHYDETGHIGEMWGPDPEDDDDLGDEPPEWHVYLWSNYGSGKSWDTDAAQGLDEAMRCAREFYEELVADRREHSRRGSARVIPTPMGGQPRRR